MDINARRQKESGISPARYGAAAKAVFSAAILGVCGAAAYNTRDAAAANGALSFRPALTFPALALYVAAHGTKTWRALGQFAGYSGISSVTDGYCNAALIAASACLSTNNALLTAKAAKNGDPAVVQAAGALFTLMPLCFLAASAVGLRKNREEILRENSAAPPPLPAAYRTIERYFPPLSAATGAAAGAAAALLTDDAPMTATLAVLCAASFFSLSAVARAGAAASSGGAESVSALSTPRSSPVKGSDEAVSDSALNPIVFNNPAFVPENAGHEEEAEKFAASAPIAVPLRHGATPSRPSSCPLLIGSASTASSLGSNAYSPLTR